MIELQLSQIAQITEGVLHGAEGTVSAVTTDSRDVVANSLFVALVGERFDGHDYAALAQTNGSLAALVQHPLPSSMPQIVVADTCVAYGRLAAWVRQQSTARVVALTGSSGKTTVKEMTAAILRQCGETLCTAGNLNNMIGVPKTLLRLQAKHRYAVIELGASRAGEIAWTTQWVAPECVLINNLAAAHLAGFGSIQGVAAAKGEIFSGLTENGTAIINQDSQDWPRWQTQLTDKRVWRFTLAPSTRVDFYASDIHPMQGGSRFQLHTPLGTVAISLPLPGQHMIANALAATALALAVDAPLSAVAAGLKQLKSLPGRLHARQLNAHQVIIDDTYNANVGSMTAAAQLLATLPGYKIMVIGDMAELGEQTATLHHDLGKLLRQLAIDKVLSVGHASQFASAASGKGEHFSDKSALVARLQALLADEQPASVLIKGSRGARMEHIVHSLLEAAPC